MYFYMISKSISSTMLFKSILAALIFSLIGDILLLWDALFIYGIGAFFIAQACYIIGFKFAQDSKIDLRNVNFIRTFIYNFPIYFLGAFVFDLSSAHLGSLKIPVIFYTLVITSMVTTARERFGKCSPSSFWQVFVGSMLFFLSDGVIALNKFYQTIADADILIMGMYAVGQLLIVMGIRSFLIEPKNIA